MEGSKVSRQAHRNQLPNLPWAFAPFSLEKGEREKRRKKKGAWYLLIKWRNNDMYYFVYGVALKESCKPLDTTLPWESTTPLVYRRYTSSIDGITWFVGGLGPWAKSRDHGIIRAQKKVSNTVLRHLHIHVVWLRSLKCSVKSYVTAPSTEYYFNEFLFMHVPHTW